MISKSRILVIGLSVALALAVMFLGVLAITAVGKLSYAPHAAYCASCECGKHCECSKMKHCDDVLCSKANE